MNGKKKIGIVSTITGFGLMAAVLPLIMLYAWVPLTWLLMLAALSGFCSALTAAILAGRRAQDQDEDQEA